MKEDKKIVELTEFVVGLDEMTVKLNFNRLLDLYLLLTAKISEKLFDVSSYALIILILLQILSILRF